MLSPVDQLAIQTCATNVRFIAAHLRKFFDDFEVFGVDTAPMPITVLAAAERTLKVLDQMREKAPVVGYATPPPASFVDVDDFVAPTEEDDYDDDSVRGGYDDVPDEDQGAGRVGR